MLRLARAVRDRLTKRGKASTAERMTIAQLSFLDLPDSALVRGLSEWDFADAAKGCRQLADTAPVASYLADILPEMLCVRRYLRQVQTCSLSEVIIVFLRRDGEPGGTLHMFDTALWDKLAALDFAALPEERLDAIVATSALADALDNAVAAGADLDGATLSVVPVSLWTDGASVFLRN